MVGDGYLGSRCCAPRSDPLGAAPEAVDREGPAMTARDHRKMLVEAMARAIGTDYPCGFDGLPDDAGQPRLAVPGTHGMSQDALREHADLALTALTVGPVFDDMAIVAWEAFLAAKRQTPPDNAIAVTAALRAALGAAEL